MDIVNDDRGQAVTLEAVVAGLVLLGSLAFALQAVAITPNTASTADAGVDTQQRGMATGVLDGALDDGSLQKTLFYWNDSAETFHESDSDDGYYVGESPPTAFGHQLAETFDDRQVRYNVAISFVTESGEPATQQLVSHGTPTDDATTVSTTVTVYEDDLLYDETGTATNTTLAEASFYAPDAVPDQPLYNVLQVEVTVWRA